MKISGLLYSTLMAVIMLTVSCNTGKKATKSGSEVKRQEIGVASPPVIIYKTRNDYSKNVPVILSEDKSKIISFPAQSDLKKEGEFVYPSQLENGYLLDNRGINQNAAFLRFTYEDYYNMDNIPDAARLMNYIADKEPFTEIYQCGRRGDYQDLINEINKKIKERKTGEFKNLLK